MGLDEYKRQQDLLFQQAEEKAALARQAKEAKIAKAMRGKRVQKTIADLARHAGTSPKEMQKRLKASVLEQE
jgi:hypothetical protein